MLAVPFFVSDDFKMFEGVQIYFLFPLVACQLTKRRRWWIMCHNALQKRQFITDFAGGWCEFTTLSALAFYYLQICILFKSLILF